MRPSICGAGRWVTAHLATHHRDVLRANPKSRIVSILGLAAEVIALRVPWANPAWPLSRPCDQRNGDVLRADWEQSAAFTPALCHVHHVREGTVIEEELKPVRAKKRNDLLLPGWSRPERGVSTLSSCRGSPYGCVTLMIPSSKALRPIPPPAPNTPEHDARPGRARLAHDDGPARRFWLYAKRGRHRHGCSSLSTWLLPGCVAIPTRVIWPTV